MRYPIQTFLLPMLTLGILTNNFYTGNFVRPDQAKYDKLMFQSKRLLLLIIVVSVLSTAGNKANAKDNAANLETITLKSTLLEKNKIGINTQRNIKVLLPTDYYQSNKRYPVVYYVHNAWWDNQRLMSENQANVRFMQAFSKHNIEPFILVFGDFTTPMGGNFFGNNEVSGLWFDHIALELIPHIDKTYRTLPHAQSRGIAGNFLGAYAALKFPMYYPDIVTSVYALHPVGTASGDRVARFLPDWKQMNRAQTWDELSGFSVPFMAMAQAHAPNPNKPPFYADLKVGLVNDTLQVNTLVTQSLEQNFSLIYWVPSHADKLQRLKGLMFDWGRYDSNPDHVYANRRFALTLENYAIEHQAEEYTGDATTNVWSEHGRVADRLIPFFDRYLIR